MNRNNTNDNGENSKQINLEAMNPGEAQQVVHDKTELQLGHIDSVNRYKRTYETAEWEAFAAIEDRHCVIDVYTSNSKTGPEYMTLTVKHVGSECTIVLQRNSDPSNYYIAYAGCSDKIIPALEEIAQLSFTEIRGATQILP